jgi:aldose 1-epimerase
MSDRVETKTIAGRAVYTLHDEKTGSSASVLPSYGFNLYDLRLPVAGEVRPVIDAAADWLENPRQAGRNGTPVLFPFPNRVRDAHYTFQGKSYTLPVNNKPNAIHGFAIDAEWDVLEHGGERGAWITGRYQISKQSPAMIDHWPSDAILQIKYTLSSGRLTLEADVTNPTAKDLPYGFGIHPYFRIPFTPGGDQSRTNVILPASQFWVLQDFLPTGETRPVDARLDFRTGQPVKGLKLDDVLTGLPKDEERVCRLVDLNLRAEFRMRFGPIFRELVVYTPPGDGGVISLEPYTQTTDAINLQARGVDAGLRVLGHGRHDRFAITMETGNETSR